MSQKTLVPPYTEEELEALKGHATDEVVRSLAMEVIRLRNLELDAKEREENRVLDEDVPHVSFEPFAEPFGDEGEWDGEYKDIAGALRLFFPRREEVCHLVRELVASLEDESWETGVFVPGVITLYADEQTAPTAIHHDKGLCEREREKWKAIEWEKEDP